MVHGLLKVDKPAGPSSADVLDRIKKRFSQVFQVRLRDLPKIGHAGTLDPFATGLLLVFFGNAVRLSEYFLKSNKAYIGTMRLGVKTSSGDLTTPVLDTRPWDHVDRESLQGLIRRFVGAEYWQKPPMYSAVKVGGKRLYQLARQGIEVDRTPVLRKIHELRILEMDLPRVTFLARVDSGTYIRTLAEDWAEAAGTFGSLESLRRIASGGFELSGNVSFDDWISSDENIRKVTEDGNFIPFDRILDGFRRVQLDERRAAEFLNGNPAVLRWVENSGILAGSTGPLAVYLGAKLIGTVHSDRDGVRFGKVFSA